MIEPKYAEKQFNSLIRILQGPIESKKNEGIYQVGNDLITFDAYSPLAVSYNKGDSVYVKIPKGDWNE